MNTPRLTRTDWINAGLRALVEGGVQALRVEPVAREIGTTKGSFYWHFKAPADWHKAMLDYFEQMGFASVVERMADLPPGSARLRALARIAATEGREPAYGGAAAELALRDWARFNAIAADTLARVDARREAYVLDQMRAADVADPERAAAVFYAAFLGFQAKAASAQSVLEGLDFLLDQLGLGGPDRSESK